MSVFVDTSALFALLDEADSQHTHASDALRRLVGTELVTHPFIVTESAALVGKRLPWSATEQLFDGLLQVVDVKPVSEELYEAAVAAYRDSSSARISLVDRMSFAMMRSLGISRAFTYDSDYSREGFELVA